MAVATIPQPFGRRERGPGGASILVCESRALPVVSLAIGFRGGVVDEPDDRLGITHVAQRLIARWRGPAGTIADVVEGLGGGITAAVERDGFGLGVTVLSRDFENAVESVREALRGPDFTEGDLVSARHEVQAERATIENSPMSRALHALILLAFRGHTYGRPVHGTPETLERITRVDVLEWLARRVSAQSLVACAVGDLSTENGARVLGELAAALPMGACPEQHDSAEGRPSGLVEGTLEGAAQSVVAIAFGGPPASSADSIVARLIGCALSMMGGRLWRAIRERPPHAYRVGASAISLRYGGVIVAHATARPGLEEATVAALAREFEILVRRGFRGAELEAAKRHLAGSLEMEMERRGSRAANYVMAEIAGTGFERAAATPTLIRSLGGEDVVRVLEEYIGRESECARVIMRADSAGRLAR
jgi:zinc protease